MTVNKMILNIKRKQSNILIGVFICFCVLSGCGKDTIPTPENTGPTPETPETPTIDDPENGIIADIEGITLKGWVHCGKKGMKGVVVTDGTHVTNTDEKGIYRLQKDSKAVHVYISSPSGYTVKTVNSVPQFYAVIDQKKKVEQKDFELLPLDNDDNKHTFVAIGDPQLYRDHEINYLRAAIEDLKDWIQQNRAQKCVHYITLGDLVFDKPQYHEPSKEIFSRLNAPVYNVIGNHDHVFSQADIPAKINDSKADTLYKRIYGPTYYSYNRGKVHYVVLDDVEYWGGPNKKYVDAISDEQIAWLKEDLKYVPKSQAVIVALHAPTKRRNSTPSFGNRTQLYQLLQGYANIQILSGHTHWNSVVNEDNSPITEHIVAAICGNWWQPELMCSEGTPIGYKIFDVDGTNIQWQYKCIDHPVDYQARIYPPENRISILHPTSIVANVWDWDPSWKVEYSTDNGVSFQPMIRPANMYDIKAYAAFGAQGDNSFPADRTWIEASQSDHMFYCSPGTTDDHIKIRITTRFGKVSDYSVPTN